jgi:Type II secretion system (T2SS), protein F
VTRKTQFPLSLYRVSRRAPPSSEDLLDALGAALGAGATVADALKLVASAGPASARAARLVEEGLAGGLARALANANLLAPDEEPLVQLGERESCVASSLAFTVARRRQRRARRRAAWGALAGPLAFAVLTLLFDPLPQVMLGTGSFAGALRNLAWLAASTALLMLGVPRILRRAKLRALVDKLPFARRLSRLERESGAALLVASFARPSELGPAAADARTLSEPFALACAAGVRAGDLPSRLRAFHDATEQTFLVRLRVILRVIAFTAAAALAARSATKLFTLPIGGDLQNLPEMQDLDHQLDELMK